MAIFIKDKEITSVFFGSKPVSAIYHGGVKVWEAVKSCFGKGFWEEEYPWSDEDAWKNNNI